MERLSTSATTSNGSEKSSGDILENEICECGHARHSHNYFGTSSNCIAAQVSGANFCSCLEFRQASSGLRHVPQKWTTPELEQLIDWVLSTDCGYCCDGADTGGTHCPQCGRAQIESGTAEQWLGPDAETGEVTYTGKIPISGRVSFGIQDGEIEAAEIEDTPFTGGVTLYGGGGGGGIHIEGASATFYGENPFSDLTYSGGPLFIAEDSNEPSGSENAESGEKSADPGERTT